MHSIINVRTNSDDNKWLSYPVERIHVGPKEIRDVLGHGDYKISLMCANLDGSGVTIYVSPALDKRPSA